MKDSLSVPDTSVMYEGSKKFVYKIIENNMVKKTEIETGVRDLGKLEILKGLNEGELDQLITRIEDPLIAQVANQLKQSLEQEEDQTSEKASITRIALCELFRFAMKP